MTPHWHAAAACKGQTATFFPRKGDNVVSQHARLICKRCPVLAACTEWAATGETGFHGIVAGMAPRERRQWRASLRLAS